MEENITNIEIYSIQNKIITIRNLQVIIDRDLAELFQIETKRLNEQVKRNINRFPEDFMFQLNVEEKNELVANCDRFKMLKHATVSPFAFTEHGAVMLACILNSKRAIEANIRIIRIFTAMREMIHVNQEILLKCEGFFYTYFFVFICFIESMLYMFCRDFIKSILIFQYKLYENQSIN